MRKNRFIALVIGIILSVSGFAHAETRGNLYFSAGFYYWFFGDEEIEIVPNITLIQMNAVKLGIGWELPLGPGNLSFGLEAGYSSGSRFRGTGGVDLFPINFTTAYVFPLAPILYIGPNLKFGTLLMGGDEWYRIKPLGGARLEAELRSRNFPLGLYVSGGVDLFMPANSDSSMLPVVEVGLRFPRGGLPRRAPQVAIAEAQRPAAIQQAPPGTAQVSAAPQPAPAAAPPPAVSTAAAPPVTPPAAPIVEQAVAPPAAVPLTVIPEAPPPVYTPAPIPSRVGYTDDGREGLLHPLYFEPDTTILVENSQLVVENVGRRLVANPSLRVLVRAFAVPYGTDDVRYLLAVNRSRVIRDSLIRNYGIAPSRIIVEAFGTEGVLERVRDEWETNRCAELLVFEY
jgi:outer membrane protein OmpA-like peptidoglycan-associated protein